MKFLKRLKSSNFWVSMISAVVLILQAVFNVEIKTEYLNQIIMAILGLLVMSGIVSDGSSDEVTVKQSVDVEAIKENMTNILTEVENAFQTNLTTVIKQFEVIRDNLTSDQSKPIENVVGKTIEHDEANVVKQTESNLIDPNSENVSTIEQKTQNLTQCEVIIDNDVQKLENINQAHIL